MGAINVAESLALLKAALEKGVPADQLTKSITTSTGLIAYDLQAPAKNLYPVLTPIRNSIPRVGGGTGTATNWRVVSKLIGSGWDASPWVAEGQRAAQMNYVTANKAASYVTIGEEDQVTFEAINAARGFEDEKAKMVMRLLQKTMIKEEDAILGGNASMALGTPTAPTVSSASTGGSIGAATYNVIVVALTYEGIRNSSVTGGVATAKTITGADGKTFTLNGGASNKSAATSSGALTGATNTISASTPVVNGAVGYAWFVGTAGNETLQAITAINSVLLTALSTGNQNASAVTADYSQNANYAFDGLLTTAFNSGTAYVKSLATGTAGTGTALTASGRGSINEIDTMLRTVWDTYRLSFDVLYVNSQELTNIINKVLSGSSNAPLVRFVMDDSGKPVVTAGQIVGFYFNPYSINGGMSIPIKLHPTVPAGTIVGWCEHLPVQYQSNEVPNVAEVKTRADFYQIDWPLVTRAQMAGVYAEEVLAVYAPFAMGIITNIANG